MSIINLNDSPMAKYTVEDCENMTQEEFIALLEANNEWLRRNYSLLFESNRKKPMPKFDTIEELDAYYGCHSLEECIDKAYKMFGV